MLRLWEFGAGDHLRQSTSVALRRIAPGRFELTSDVDVLLSLPARSIELIVDGKPREIAPARTDSGWLTLQLPPCHRAVELRVARSGGGQSHFPGGKIETVPGKVETVPELFLGRL